MHKKYTGFYLGYVVQNNDPDRGGKVKVFIPSLMPTLAGVSEEINKEDAKVEINFKDFSTLPGSVIENLKNILPWARQISPLIGPGASTSYNPENHLVTTVDNAIHRIDFAKKLKEGNEPLNDPKSPGFTLQQNEFILSAGNIKTEISDSNKIPATRSTDPDNNSFLPELYSNQAKGMFSIPSVGSLVWVFFENGEWDLPVYFGYHYSSSAWREVYGSNEEGQRGLDYPNNFENNKKSNSNSLIREKLIFNSRAGSLSFTGTDYFPKINLSHQQGSFVQMDNSGYKRMIYGKSSEFVLGEEYKTIKGDSITRAYKNFDIVCDQSMSVRTGSRNYDIYEKAKDVIAERASILANFKTERTAGLTDAVFGDHKANLDETRRVANPNIYKSSGATKPAPGLRSVRTLTPKEVKEKSQSSAVGMAIPWDSAEYKNISTILPRSEPRNAGLDGGEYVPPFTKKFAWATPDTYSRFSTIGGWDTRAGNKTKSPSTAGGSYNRKEGTSSQEIKNKLIDINKKLDEVLKNDNDGGDHCIEITKDYYMRVGAINNDFPAVRVDPIGGIVFAGVVQGDNGAASIYKQTNLVEYTGNDSNFPCGNYTISCGNKFSIDSGGGGITLKTTGVSEIAGVTTKISGLHLIELTTSGSISLDAGKSLTITADILSLRQSKNKQMALGGSVGVENNITVGGSAIVNGELYLQHVTAPAEIQTTDQVQQLRGWTRTSDTVGSIPEGRVVARLTEIDCVDIVNIAAGYSGQPQQPSHLGELIVRVKAWNPDGVPYGIPPQYEYDPSLDEYVEKSGTGFKTKDRSRPETVAESNEDVPIDGTDRVTSIELEAHAHQFKNLPLSLRATPEDVVKEARDIESYPEVRGLAKGSRPAKILVKEYGESKKHKKLQAYSSKTRSSIANNNQSDPLITGRGVGNEDDVRTS
jgi:hypothetical protein